MNTKRQHYVTRSYLSLFVASDEGKDESVWVYDKVTKDVRLQPIKDTAVIRHFYTFDAPDGTKRDWLERIFSDIESKSIPIIKRWGHDRAVPTVEEIRIVAMFLACLYVRVPRAVDVMKTIAEIAALARMEILAEDEVQFAIVYKRLMEDEQFNHNFTSEELRALVKDFGAHFSIEADRKYALLCSIQQIGNVYSRLVQRYWCLCDSRPFGGRFLTCDAPVNAFYFQDGKARFFGGLGDPKTEINFPLSPYVCLSLSATTRTKRRRVNPTFVMEINRRMAYQAQRYIFSSIRTRRVDLLVQDCRKNVTASLVDISAMKEVMKTSWKRPSAKPDESELRRVGPDKNAKSRSER